MSRLMLLFTPLGPELRHFGRWLEDEALPSAVSRGESTLELYTKSISEDRYAIITPDGPLKACPSLAGFLNRLGVHTLRLDVRLERTQVTDVIALLHGFRRSITRRENSSCARDLAGKLACEDGVLLSCTQTRLTQGTLEVDYSYCVTRLNKFVQWFETRHHHFNDHRAIFNAAPRYALASAAVAVIPFVLYWALPYWWVLMVATVLEVAALFTLVYVSLMVVGSVEYDNEEKAHRLSRANRQLDEYAQRIRADLKRAENIQRKMIPSPQSMPFGDDLEWASTFVPEEEVGGDYFDVAALDEHRVAILFSDVSGHGMSAAFITAILKTAFQGWVDDRTAMVPFLERLNDLLLRLTPEGAFAATFAAEYDIRTGELTYVNAGHNPEPWIISVEDGRRLRQLSDARSLLLGVSEDIAFRPRQASLQPGDMILFATDGVIEAVSPRRVMYSRKRLIHLLENHPVDNANDLVKRLNEDVGRFTEGAPQTDDRTVLAMRVKEA
ncbi:MAG: PP2C family protein-serine/threonine phosphatase [Phycisphaerae bacterium]